MPGKSGFATLRASHFTHNSSRCSMATGFKKLQSTWDEELEPELVSLRDDASIGEIDRFERHAVLEAKLEAMSEVHQNNARQTPRPATKIPVHSCSSEGIYPSRPRSLPPQPLDKFVMKAKESDPDKKIYGAKMCEKVLGLHSSQHAALLELIERSALLPSLIPPRPPPPALTWLGRGGGQGRGGAPSCAAVPPSPGARRRGTGIDPCVPPQPHCSALLTPTPTAL